MSRWPSGFPLIPSWLRLALCIAGQTAGSLAWRWSVVLLFIFITESSVKHLYMCCNCVCACFFFFHGFSTSSQGDLRVSPLWLWNGQTKHRILQWLLSVGKIQDPYSLQRQPLCGGRLVMSWAVWTWCIELFSLGTMQPNVILQPKKKAKHLPLIVICNLQSLILSGYFHCWDTEHHWHPVSN